MSLYYTSNAHVRTNDVGDTCWALRCTSLLQPKASANHVAQYIHVCICMCVHVYVRVYMYADITT